MSAVYQQIINYIDAHIKQDITIADIANEIGYSANHIYKIFKVYSPYPVMEYIRRKKLYFAASEMYSGRKIYNIALDYGYETPAGFYKAFKAIFGCSPSAYKNNNLKDGKNMFIENVKNLNELDAVLQFFRELYPQLPVVPTDGGKYSRKFWIEEWQKHPSLLLFAKDGDALCGIAIGWADGCFITIAGDGVLPQYKNKGLHEALLVELEKRAKAIESFKGLVLGIGEGEEEFYAKLGYTGTMLVQSEKYSVDELIAFNQQFNDYEITGTNVYDGYVNQIWLNVSLLDKCLKSKYEKETGDCWVQIVVSKEF